ncbi:transporter substrate-binding domain-containing protein [Oxalobacteraceae bacterium]|nr:transporter substrate-binding domain-containing protein [Oxalobacteraceae bacterium]
MKNAVLLCALAMACLPGRAADATTPPIRLVTLLAPDTPLYGQFARLIDSAFSQLQQPYTLSYQPARLAAASFKAGLFDGDISRSAQFRGVVPDAIAVTPPIYAIRVIAVSRQPTITITSWDDLKPYRVAYRRGFQAIERPLQDVKGRYAVDTDASCMAMVQLRRMDVCVGDEALLSHTLATQDDDFRIDYFDQLPSFVWLAPRHAALAARLGQVLKAMEGSGELARFFQTPEKHGAR